MKAATWPRAEPLEERLLVVDPKSGLLRDSRLDALPSFLSPGDVLVVNDAATLPASLHTEARDLEMRLLARLGDDRTYRALFFGTGDFRTPTENRPDPPELAEGTLLSFDFGLRARIVAVDPASARLADVRFDLSGAALFRALYRAGKPIQYAHVEAPLQLWHVQSPFAGRPWAFEAPSAGRPLTWGLLRRLLDRGVRVTSLTHAAGISSTGSSELDRRLPMAERYFIPENTVAEITEARRRGSRVVAVGTTVTRALESSAAQPGLEPGAGLGQREGEARLILGPGFRPRVTTGLLTGMHAPGTSHFALLEAFAPRALLERAVTHADREGYLEHEFGDSCLVLPGSNESANRRIGEYAKMRKRSYIDAYLTTFPYWARSLVRARLVPSRVVA